MTDTNLIPSEFYTETAVNDYLGTVERGVLDSRTAQSMHAESLAHAVMRGDLLWARTHAITLALHRDNRPTYGELIVSRNARDSHYSPSTNR